MKKTIAVMMSVLMLLSVSIFVFADVDELVPGTAFPMPDSLTSVKSVSTDRMQEEIMLQLMGVDVVIDVVYADEAAASQALGEYRSKLELLSPV